MLTPRLPVALLLSVLGFGCTEATTTSNDSPATGIGINGPHTGEVWTINRYSGSQRFNLQTSQTTKVSDGLAYPTRDGSVFVEVFIDHENNVNCISSSEDFNLLNVRNTRTGSVLGSFKLSRDFTSTVRLSPDGEHIAMKVARASTSCDSDSKDKRLTIFSKDGVELYRHVDETVVSFDWHPDGRLVIVKKLSTGANQYGLQIETEPRSNVFESEGLFSWNPAPDVTGYIGFRVGPTGNDAVLEEIVQSAHFVTGNSWRNSRTRHFTMFEIADESAMFVHDVGDNPRVNAPVFSPDGQHILVTEGYSSSSVVFNATTLDLDTLGFNQTDELGTFSVLSVSGNSMSYIVPAGQKLQPMPPKQYSENIQPVLANRGDGVVSTVSFAPIYPATWTPVID